MSAPSPTAPGRNDLLHRPLPSSPPPPPLPLGLTPLHGPPRHEHLVLIIGVGPGMGLCIAQHFAAQGYATALLSRDVQRLEGWARELDVVAKERLRRDREEANQSGSQGKAEEAAPLSRGVFCDVLDPDSVLTGIRSALQLFPGRKLGTAIYNASVRVKRPFLAQTEAQVRDSFQASIMSSFVFMKECVTLMKGGEEGVGGAGTGSGGTILATGATSATRGRASFAAFSMGKTGLRRICEVAAREHGKDNIHIAHIVIDGLIDSSAARKHLGLSDSEYFHDDTVVDPREAAKAYLFLAQQAPSAWTFEMDLRPAREHF
ncbi:NAD(P)-binding protein [Microstroma glucosiphilum]|uniref:NAD(P)-binding protein n=1 Tax=Pseudomicrostroma glucosiphilum TaxID=1684307 RepID=A0A316U404_9BASI|nr:NAD(P)-binding protein [Pseudomicrostroma glucosiphilum]PWN19528.1 NAD(P)-binding protein [Pseudomicrostroma glucosiphilum]